MTILGFIHFLFPLLSWTVCCESRLINLKTWQGDHNGTLVTRCVLVEILTGRGGQCELSLFTESHWMDIWTAGITPAHTVAHLENKSNCTMVHREKYCQSVQ